MAFSFNGDPSQMRATSQKMTGYQGDLESHLARLDVVRNSLSAAVVSERTGPAIQNALSSLHANGKALSSSLLETSETLGGSAVRMDSSDSDGGAVVNAAVNGGDVSSPTKVDTQSWS